jgi:hypothetical protein
MIITFFYKIKGEMYYGKYIGYVSDDYEEGLDIEVLNLFYPVWKRYYSLLCESDVSLGIVSYQRNGSDYFSENEKHVFHSLYCNWSNQEPELFLHGILHSIK